MWPLNVGQVYTTLQRLERDGLVETDAEGERSQKRYRITAAGVEELTGGCARRLTSSRPRARSS